MVIASGTVDTNVVGDYILTYNYTDSHGNSAPQVTRTVRVVDTIPPFIITGSIVVNPGITGAIISWQTSEQASSQVAY